MSRKFPSLSRTDPPADRTPRLVDVEDEAAEEIFDALGSETARQLFATLQEESLTASELAERLDCSVQNVAYHLERLGDADLVEVVDTCYSDRGTEMNIYAPADEALVVFAGEDEASTLRTLLSRIGLAVPLLALAWVVLDRAVRDLGGLLPGGGAAGDGGDAAPGGTGTQPAGTEPGPGAVTTARGPTDGPAATGDPPAATEGPAGTRPAAGTGTAERTVADGATGTAATETAGRTANETSTTATTGPSSGSQVVPSEPGAADLGLLDTAGGAVPLESIAHLAGVLDSPAFLAAAGLVAVVSLVSRRRR